MLAALAGGVVVSKPLVIAKVVRDRKDAAATAAAEEQVHKLHILQTQDSATKEEA
jgi:hypothetical protein